MSHSETMLIDNPGEALAPGASAELKRRAIRATRVLIAQSGLDVSMDQIAAASGVGRRSLFRHFRSRDALVAEALDSAFRWYEAQLEPVIAHDGPLDEWLQTMLRRTHQTHLDAGRGLWQLASAFDDELPAEFAAPNKRRRAMRRRVTRNMAEGAWRIAGATAPVPDILVETMSIVVSSFVTHSMVHDRKRSLESLVRSSVVVLLAVIRDALAHEPGATRASGR